MVLLGKRENILEMGKDGVLISRALTLAVGQFGIAGTVSSRSLGEK